MTASEGVGRSLVLGGGGLVGTAWLLGVVEGLGVGGFDLTDGHRPDQIIGTSAGSIVGALLAGGHDLASIEARVLADDVTALALRAAAAVDTAAVVAVNTRWASMTSRDAAELRSLGSFAVDASTLPEGEFIAAIEREVGTSWPADPRCGYRCITVDASSGALRAFDARSGVGLARAVAASCAVPAVFPAVAIGGSRFMDGGARSCSNADLALGASHILVLAPIGSAGDPFDDAQARILQSETAQLRRAGASVTTLLPDAEANAATLVTALGRMDPRRRAPALAHGRRQGALLAETLAGHW